MGAESTNSLAASLPLGTTRKELISIGVLVLFHLVGIAGFVLHVPHFERLTPLHLGVATAVWAVHQRFDRRLAAALGLAFVVGVAVEFVGVTTGWPFGAYHYDHALGPKVVGVPPLIGLNWALLTAATGGTAALVPLPTALTGDGAGRAAGVGLRALMAAGLMVLLDTQIEPFAMTHGFWTWHASHVPAENYVAWFVVALALAVPYQILSRSGRNPISPWVVGCQLAFFALLNAVH